MHEGEENGGDRKRARSTSPGGVVIYKRRKRSSMSSGIVFHGDPNVCSGDQPDAQKAREMEYLVREDFTQLGGHNRTENLWKAILGGLLSEDADDGIWSFIKEAFASSNLGIHSNLNVHDTEDKKPEVTLQRDTTEEEDSCVIAKNWEKVLIEVLTSEKFAFLCNLLLGSFPRIKASSIIDFKKIQSKMEKVACGHSIGQLHQDLQQVWERIQNIGQEMVLLATSLSNLSQIACQKQRSKMFGIENFSGSRTTTQFPYESEPCTKPGQTEVPCLYKVSTCKHCGSAADGKCSLICDGCEATYHFSCVKPAVKVIPTQSWYCSACTTGRKLCAEPDTAVTSQDSVHQECIVCNRLKALGALEQQRHDGDGDESSSTADDSRESSVSGMVSEETPELSTTALACLCKICGTCEDDDRKFIKCSHNFCVYRYYHVRCLRTSQIASQHQQRGCWYCPSCLCRACFVNKDDDKIVMCDGCDEAYHTYCMKPPRSSVPEGNWYCVACNILRAKEGMRRYEQCVLQQHGQGDGKRTSGSRKSVGMLPHAAGNMETPAATKRYA